MSEWIKCSDRLPKFGISTRYLFVNGKDEVTFGYAYPLSENIIWIYDMNRETNEVATHWMELPTPPNESDL